MVEPSPTEKLGAHAPHALVIAGATATGKTDLSIAVAKALNGEIISMDSRQVYRGMDVGTAKPTPHQLAAVPHYGIDLIDPDQRYNAGRFAVDSRRWIGTIRSRGHVPVLVGGTGFFLRALTHPLFAEPELPAERRTSLLDWLDRKPADQLQHWLTVLDPESANRLATGGGRQRILRALEVVLLSGHPLGWWQQRAPQAAPALRLLVFLLELPREELYRRINQRVISMIECGFEAEVRGLVQKGYARGAPGLNATGYSELLDLLDGRIDLAEAIDATQRATRQLARRQLTWFRHQLPAGAVVLDAQRPVQELVNSIVQRWRGEVDSAHRN